MRFALWQGRRSRREGDGDGASDGDSDDDNDGDEAGEEEGAGKEEDEERIGAKEAGAASVGLSPR